MPIVHTEIAVTYQSAIKYDVIGLCDKLLDYCQTSLDIENSLVIFDQYLRLEKSISEDELQYFSNKCLNLIKMHTYLAFQSNQFLKISKEAMLTLLEGDYLFIREIDLYIACLKSIKANFKDDEQLNQLKSIRSFIRWPLMSKKQLDYAIASTSGKQLFSEQELKEFGNFFKTKKLN